MSLPPLRPKSPGPAESRREGSVPPFPTCAYGGIILPLMVRNYLHRKGLTKIADRQPDLSPVVLRSCSSVVAPICRRSASRCREVVVPRGDEGGRVTTLSTPPSPEDPDPGGGLHPLPPHRSSGATPISLYHSLRPRFLTGGASRLPPRGILGRIGIPRLIAATPKTLRKTVSVVKR
jgi:hypothetical protein